MATEKLTLTIAQKSNTDTQRVVTATLTYYGNGVSYSGYDCPATITFNGTKKSWSSTIHPTTSTSAQVVKTQDFTVTKTHSAQSLTGSATFTVTGTSLGTMSTTSSAYSVPAKTSYTVSYAANGGSGTTTAQTKWYGESLTLRGSLTKTGYTFNKWKATNGTLYSAGASYTANAATTMTAQWTANTYYVKFNANGGSGSMTNETFAYGTAKNLTNNTFTKVGYSFAGWNTKSDGTGTNYSNGQSVSNLTTTANGTVNLYAKWTPNIYKITLNKSGGSGGTSAYYEKYGAGNYPNADGTGSFSPANTISIPSQSQYNFGGYFTGQDGTGTQYVDSLGKIISSSTTFTSATNLYAYWTAAYIEPKINNAQAIRCTDTGRVDKAGGYVKIIFDWNAGIDASGSLHNNTKIEIKKIIGAISESVYVITETAQENGSIQQIVQFDINKSGVIEIILQDNIEETSVSKSINVTEGGFPVHISATGEAIKLFGICKDSDKGLIVNDKITIDNGSRSANFLISPNNLIGVYDNTNSNYVLYSEQSENEQIVHIPHKLELGTRGLLNGEYVTAVNCKLLTKDRNISYYVSAANNCGLWNNVTNKALITFNTNDDCTIPHQTTILSRTMVYEAGDQVSCNGAQCAGHLTTSKTDVTFFIPLPKPTAPNLKATISGNWTIRHADGGYIMQAAALTSIGTIAAVSIYDLGVYVRVALSTASSFTNNSVICVSGAASAKITFSANT